MRTFEALPGTKWLSVPVFRREIPLAALPDALPSFSREPLGVNDYLELIVRKPFDGDDRSIPIATVSKRYALVQHTDVARQVCQALIAAEAAREDTRATVLLSPYGERLACTMLLAQIQYDPGDKYPLFLRLHLRNSVDGSCAFELALRWWRQVCSNGLTVLQRQDRLREIHHLDRMNPIRTTDFLRNRLPVATERASIFASWIEIPVSDGDLSEWADGDVAKAWGSQAAARVLHISRTGYDGRVGRVARRGKLKASQLAVSSDRLVPGACAPVDNVYHTFQVLTWVVETRGSVETREQWAEEALALIRRLEKRLLDVDPADRPDVETRVLSRGGGPASARRIDDLPSQSSVMSRRLQATPSHRARPPRRHPPRSA